ncbi:hypothetical protein R6V09_02690 [Streptomyces sp. W16]|uniref:hypothetical protein n=1 Tax=Streptomyces sp. W16 TaxID=3076631 RepID=UPI00295C2DB9|nr:hypothetical protein [Streptomyces sp. W16]MDV9169045.1 hypothetical protein [Streptomyces sp. W16]
MRPKFAIVAVAALLGTVAGCGEDGGGSSAPAPGTSQRITVTSTAPTESGTVPRDGEGVTPPPAFAGAPANPS